MNELTIRCNMTVELVDSMGNDLSIIQAARVSTGNDLSVPDPKGAAGLLGFLMKNRHGTPFEHGAMKFRIEAPIFVFREFHRHRIGWSYNETSGRYRELEPTFYVPAQDRPLVQTGKPGHYEFVEGTWEQHEETVNALCHSYQVAWNTYQQLLRQDVAKEVARVCLPVGIYSSMYATCNPRSLMAFLSLRTKRDESKFPSYPQREIEMVAEAMEVEFADLFPVTYAAFEQFGRVSP